MIGPPLIADKSVYQGLKPELTTRLVQLFFPIHTTVFFRECAGDLGKSESIEGSVSEYLKAAKGIGRGFDRFLPDVQTLLDLEKSGEVFLFDGRPIEIPRSVTQSSGGCSVLIDEEPERETIRRWVGRRFEKGEREFWRGVRAAGKGYPLEDDFRGLKDELPDFHSSACAMNYLADAFEEQQTLKKLVEIVSRNCISSPRDLLARLGVEIDNGRLNGLRYHKLILKIILLFYLLLVSGIITTRRTNLIDLEYLFYLPFCKVFSSGDDIHREIFDAISVQNCVFIEKESLRSELLKIESYFSSFSNEDSQYYRKTYGNYPPPILDSEICFIWEKFMGPRKMIEPPKVKPDMDAMRRSYMSHFRT